MNLEETLNYQIATKVFRWTVKVQGHTKAEGCYDEDGNYQGLLSRFAWTYDLGAAFTLLGDHEWRLSTCDAGYVCSIYTAPEKGEILLGEGVDDTIPLAICHAVIEASETKIAKANP